MDTELEQFPVNVWHSPEWIFAAQHADQFAHVFRHRWAAGLAVPNLPTPEQAKALSCQPITVAGWMMKMRASQPF